MTRDDAQLEVEVVALSGPIDHAVSRDLQESLLDVVRNGRSRLVLDLDAVPLVDSSGLGVIVTLLKAARAAGGNLVLANVAGPIQDVLRLTRVDRALDSFESRQEAVDHLSS